MRTDLFDFDLPDDRIALAPASPRDAARLLVVKGGVASGELASGAPSRHSPFPTRHPRLEPEQGEPEEGIHLQDRHIADLPALLRPGDALVVNDTRVIRAALSGERVRGANRAAVSFNLHKRLDGHRWLAFARPAKRLATGDRVLFGHGADNDGRVCLLGTLEATVARVGEAGEVELAFSLHGAYLDEAIEAVGKPPLPPYIAGKREVEPADTERYQTVFARREGAVAAPTAGLHFTDRLLAALKERGISRHCVTLHVGAGTFLPVKAEDTAAHRMHSEWGEITPETAAALNAARGAGGRIVAVGTTALRVLETAAAEDGTIRPFAGETDIFITPGYRFKAVGVLLTNFHLPRSTLFMLVAAFSGLQTMQGAYAHAIRAGYRFYSYGDACLLHPIHAAYIPEAEPRASLSGSSGSESGSHGAPDRTAARAGAHIPPSGMTGGREGGEA
jgi:S-adenosylmethionine:tRNA ribosyltransferase-isomerase